MSKTVRLDSIGHGEACLPTHPQPTKVEQPQLTACQIFLQEQPNDPVEKAKPSVDHSTDRLRSPTKKRIPGTPEKPPPIPVPPKPTKASFKEYPDKTALPVEDPPRPGTATPAATGGVKRNPSPKVEKAGTQPIPIAKVKNGPRGTETKPTASVTANQNIVKKTETGTTVKPKIAIGDGSVKSASKDPVRKGKPSNTGHQIPASKLGEALTKSLVAFIKLLKLELLSSEELKTWDDDLARFFGYQRIIRSNPDLTYTHAKLFPNATVMHSRQPSTPPPLITLDGSDQGPPPLSGPAPEKPRPLPTKNSSLQKLPQPTPLQKKLSVIPNLPSKAIPLKSGAATGKRTISTPSLAYSESPQRTETEPLDERAKRMSADNPPRSHSKRKASFTSMSSPSDRDNFEDLRDTLNQKQNQRVSLGSGRRRHVMARGENNVPYDHLLHQYSRDQQERTSANSDFERRHRSDGSALQSPDSSCERSSKDSYRGSVRRDRSRRREAHHCKLRETGKTARKGGGCYEGEGASKKN